MINVNINEPIKITIHHEEDGRQVSNSDETKILRRLQDGIYTLDLEEKVIRNTQDPDVMYTVTVIDSEETEFEFE